MPKATNEMYEQFKNLRVPTDIKPHQPFDLVTLKRALSEERKKQLPLDRYVFMSLNCRQFRPNELQVHTADIGTLIKPDFDFRDLEEMDPWRKTCKLKYNIQQFQEMKVDVVRCEGFFQKCLVCEALTIFQEVYGILKDDGQFIVTIPNFFKIFKELATINRRDFRAMLKCENIIFSPSDSTGLYYNRTIWSLDRLETYLEMAGFKTIKPNLDASEDEISVIAKK